MKFYLDTEFIEDGKTIDLLSIAVVPEGGGQEFYAINLEADWEKANDWVRVHVLPRINVIPDGNVLIVKSIRGAIAEALIKYIESFPHNGKEKAEFWGYYADYDWVATAQLFGTMMSLPKRFPMYCNDLKQLSMQMGDIRLPKQSGEHNALMDARWNRESHNYLLNLSKNPQ